MSQLMFSLDQQVLPSGQKVPLRLSVRHTFSSPLYNLCLRLQVGPGVQVLGSEKVCLAELRPGEPTTLEIYLHARQAGPAELRLKGLNARSEGKNLIFPEAILSLSFGPLQFPVSTLSLSVEPGQLEQNVPSDLRLRLHNNSPFLLEAVDLNCDGDELAFGEKGRRLGWEALSPAGWREGQLSVRAKAAGDLHLKVHLSARFQGERVAQTFERTLKVKPASVPLQMGDSITIIRNSGTAADTSASSQVKIEAGEDKFEFNRGQEARSNWRRCPSCGQETWSGRYCDNCHYDFGPGLDTPGIEEPK